MRIKAPKNDLMRKRSVGGNQLLSSVYYIKDEFR